MVFASSGVHGLIWSDLVSFLSFAFQDVYYWGIQFISYFTTPILDLAERDTGVSSWLIEALNWILNLFGINILHLTPLELMLGSFLPFVIVFIVFKFFKQ